MAHYYIKPKAFYDSFQDVQPSQPCNFGYGERPTFTFSFLPNEISVGDLLVYAVDNDMTFYDSTPENILHSASCMVVVKHTVTAEEAAAGTVEMEIETRTVKFRDTVNGKVRPVDVVAGLYRLRGSDDSANYVLMAKARAFANGIIADYDSLPEPITTDDYYTKDEIDAKIAAKADESDLTAHTGDTDIHVTLQDKTAWDSKADLNDIGSATITITQGGVSKGAFSANASEDVTIDLDNGGAQADWNETSSSSPSFILNKPSIYTQSETDALLSSKADVATTIAGYGITDAYTKTEVDSKISAVYRYKGSVSAYSDLPTEDQEVGDVYNVATADAQHGIKAGDNVAWNGTTWDVLAGEIDLSAYATKAELAPVATTGSYTDLTNKPVIPPDATDYLCITRRETDSTVAVNKSSAEAPAWNLEYSFDKQTWIAYTWTDLAGATITLDSTHPRVYLRGNEITPTNQRYTCSMTGSIDVSGDIMSLYNMTATVPQKAFYYFFRDCTSIVDASKLRLPFDKATYLAFAGMFQGCTNLVSVPVVTRIDTNACNMIFNGCTSLSRIEVGFAVWGNSQSLHYNWVNNVAASGTFVCPPALDTTTRDASHVPSGWTVVRTEAVQADWSESTSSSPAYIKNKPDLSTKLDAPTTAGTVGQVLKKSATGTEWDNDVDEDALDALDDLSTMLDSHIGASDSTNYFCIVATRDGQAISVGNDGQWGTGTVLEYSIDKTNWFEFDPTTTAKTVLLNTGMKMYLRGDNNLNVIPHGCHPFQGDWILDGNMKSLWSKTLEPEYAITDTYNWFSGSAISGFGANFAFPSFDSVTTMQGMFSQCASLTAIPSSFSIPSSVTNCNGMFSGCASLVSLPTGFSIPSSVTDCGNMFTRALVGGEIPVPPANATSIDWYASYGGGTSNPSTLAAGWKVPDGCTKCSYALYNRGLTSLPDGFQIPASITDDGQVFKGQNAVTTFGDNVSFLKQNASWHNDYIQFNTVTTIGDNFTLTCDNAPSTDPYVCFPHLTSLGTNCNINGTITNPA